MPMPLIELTRNSRTGGADMEGISAALKARGVAFTLNYNARAQGYGVADVLTVDPTGQEARLTPSEWGLLPKGYAPPPALPVGKARFRVWIEQVNQTFVDVIGDDEGDARDKGYRKWRKECAHSTVCGVKRLQPGDV